VCGLARAGFGLGDASRICVVGVNGLGDDGEIGRKGVDVACCEGVEALWVKDGSECWKVFVSENASAHMRPVFGEAR
jgi:hypothetical protein